MYFPVEIHRQSKAPMCACTPRCNLQLANHDSYYIPSADPNSQNLIFACTDAYAYQHVVCSRAVREIMLRTQSKNRQERTNMSLPNCRVTNANAHSVQMQMHVDKNQRLVDFNKSSETTKPPSSQRRYNSNVSQTCSRKTKLHHCPQHIDQTKCKANVCKSKDANPSKQIGHQI